MPLPITKIFPKSPPPFQSLTRHPHNNPHVVVLCQLPSMATQAQIDANRRNSQKSTGPATDAGKLASSLNALKTGLYAESLTALDSAYHRALADLERLQAKRRAAPDPLADEPAAKIGFVPSPRISRGLVRSVRSVRSAVPASRCPDFPHVDHFPQPRTLRNA